MSPTPSEYWSFFHVNIIWQSISNNSRYYFHNLQSFSLTAKLRILRIEPETHTSNPIHIAEIESPAHHHFAYHFSSNLQCYRRHFPTNISPVNYDFEICICPQLGAPPRREMIPFSIPNLRG